MFPLKKIVRKLKHITNCRGVAQRVILSGSFVFFVWFLWRHFNPPVAIVPQFLLKYLQYPEGYQLIEKQLSETELNNLKIKVDKHNLKAEVFNLRQHGFVSEKTTMIVIQVHKDVERLQHLIISLAQVLFIQDALLVFSHSYYHEDINGLVGRIDFCKYMQIFYPYTLQLNPNNFPGVDPADCNSSAGPGASARGACLERDARRTEHKQHWWWKAHMIFDGLKMTSQKRIVIFLEEDDYVLPDLLYMLRYTRRTLAYFPTAEVIALGRPYATGLDYDALIVDTWTPLYDKGLAFNSSTWKKISAQASLYCLYDDCSWSYSLAHLFGGFGGGQAEAAACAAPRVLGTRSAGGGRAGLRWAGELARRAPLFPSAVRAVVTVGAEGRVRRSWSAPRGNGGWSDLRDHMLCLDPFMLISTEPTASTASTPYSIRNTSLAAFDKYIT